MILGTHNTMTYRTPKKWYLIPLRFLSQCQAVDYKVQHEKYGVNAFDIRLFWDKNGKIEFRHGLISYDATDILDFWDYCNKEHMIVRVLFEERNFPWLKKLSKEKNLKEAFRSECEMLEEMYPNIVFYGGRNSDTNEQIYDFENNVQDVGYYSSVTSMFKSDNKILAVLDDWFPFIYAFLMNKENKQKIDTMAYDADTIVHFDFVNIG